MPNDSEPTWDSTTEVAPTWEQTAPAQNATQSSQSTPPPISLAQALGGVRSGTQTDVSEAKQFVEQPGIEIPRIPQQQGTLAQLGAGAVNAASGLVEGLVSPQTIASLPVVPLKLSQVLFGGQALQDIGQAYNEAAQPGTTVQRGLELGGRALSDAIFGVGLVHGATRGFAEPPPPIQAEPLIQTAAAKAEQLAATGGEHAIQEPGAGEILQRQPQEIGTTGSERGRVEPSVQGQETAAARQGTEAQPEAPQTPVAPQEPVMNAQEALSEAKKTASESDLKSSADQWLRDRNIDPDTADPMHKALALESAARDEVKTQGSQRLADERTNVLNDLQNGNPISKDAITTHGISVPEGYVAQGDQYVYKPEIPEGATAKVNFTTSKGEQVTREMNAGEAEGIFTKERSSFQALLDCLGR